MRSAASHKFYRIGLHLKSGNPKASDRARHMHSCGDQQPQFTALWFEQRGRVQCVLGSRPRSGFYVNAGRVDAEIGKSLNQFLVGGAKSAEGKTCFRVVLTEF